MSKTKEIGVIALPNRITVLVCRKCSRKLDGGFGRKGREDLRDVLKHELRETGLRREVRVMQTGCLSLCPKDAVTLLVAGPRTEMLKVPEGTDAQTVLERLRAF